MYCLNFIHKIENQRCFLILYFNVQSEPEWKKWLVNFEKFEFSENFQQLSVSKLKFSKKFSTLNFFENYFNSGNIYIECAFWVKAKFVLLCPNEKISLNGNAKMILKKCINWNELIHWWNNIVNAQAIKSGQ